MSNNMPGDLSLSEIQGPMKDLFERLCSRDARGHLRKLKKHLRGLVPHHPEIEEDDCIVRFPLRMDRDQGHPPWRLDHINSLEPERVSYVYTNGAMTEPHLYNIDGSLSVAIITGFMLRPGLRVASQATRLAMNRGFVRPGVDVAYHFSRWGYDYILAQLHLSYLRIMHQPVDLSGSPTLIDFKEIVLSGSPAVVGVSGEDDLPLDGNMHGDVGFLYLEPPPR